MCTSDIQITENQRVVSMRNKSCAVSVVTHEFGTTIWLMQTMDSCFNYNFDVERLPERALFSASSKVAM